MFKKHSRRFDCEGKSLEGDDATHYFYFQRAVEPEPNKWLVHTTSIGKNGIRQHHPSASYLNLTTTMIHLSI